MRPDLVGRETPLAFGSGARMNLARRPVSLISIPAQHGLRGVQALRRAHRRHGAGAAWRYGLGLALLGLGGAWVAGNVIAPGSTPVEPGAVYVEAEQPAQAEIIESAALDESPVSSITLPSKAEPMGLSLTRYKVKPGDTVHQLAAEFGISAETIVWANDLADADLLGIDDDLDVPPVSGVLHRVRPGDTVADLADWYSGSIKEIIEINRLAPPFIIVVGQPLMVPGGRVPPQRSAEEPDAGPSLPPLPIPPSANEDQKNFILSLARPAQRSQINTGIPSSVTLAQAILETYWGSSRLAREANNYFGIKAKESPGPAGVVWFNVWEHSGGRDIMSNEPFRAYNTVEESFIDHGQWFHRWPRYANALAVRQDAKLFARAINAAGYATDPAYATKLIALMDRFNLYAYDLS